MGADLRAALVASCLRGALPPVDLRAVCLVRAMWIGRKWESEEKDAERSETEREVVQEGNGRKLKTLDDE